MDRRQMDRWLDEWIDGKIERKDRRIENTQVKKKKGKQMTEGENRYKKGKIDGSID